MEATFPMYRATKAMLQQRVTDLTFAYNELAREANWMCDVTVPFTASRPMKKGETVIIRIPKRFIVRNR